MYNVDVISKIGDYFIVNMNINEKIRNISFILRNDCNENTQAHKYRTTT